MNLNLQGLTINPAEETDISKAIFEAILEMSDIAEHHDIHTGIDYDTQIPFIGNLGLVGKKILNCKPDANGNKIPFSEKFWRPKLIGDRFEHCATDLDAMFKLFKRAKKVNPDFFNRIDSEELGVVYTRVEQAMREMIQRLVWFGDENITNVSAGGYLTDGTDVAFFNVINGLWQQIMTTGIPVTSKYYVPIPQNAQPTYALQEALPVDFAFKLFRDMWRKADPRLKQLVGKNNVKLDIHVTSALAENWRDYKEDKSLIFTLDKVENGGLKEAFRNINIITRYDWDANIQAYQDNGVMLHMPHRALMTTPGNIPVGTLSTDDLEKLTSEYNSYHQVNFMDFALKLDTKFLQDYLAVAAY